MQSIHTSLQKKNQLSHIQNIKNTHLYTQINSHTYKNQVRHLYTKKSTLAYEKKTKKTAHMPLHTKNVLKM